MVQGALLTNLTITYNFQLIILHFYLMWSFNEYWILLKVTEHSRACCFGGEVGIFGDKTNKYRYLVLWSVNCDNCTIVFWEKIADY